MTRATRLSAVMAESRAHLTAPMVLFVLAAVNALVVGVVGVYAAMSEEVAAVIV